MRMCLMAVASLAFLGVCPAGAQEGADKPPYQFRAEGDTVESFKASLTVHQKVDQASARGTVEAWAGFSDGRDVTRNADAQVRQKWQAAVQKSLAPWEELLLTTEMRESLARFRAEEQAEGPGKDRTTNATEVTSESSVDEKTAQVETLQKVVSRVPGKDGQVTEQAWEVRYRYTCSRGEDGKWRINKLERKQRDWEQPDKEVWVWKPEIGMLSIIYMMLAQAAPKAAVEPRQATAEEAARSLYESLIAREAEYGRKVSQIAFPLLRDQMEQLFTAEYLEAAKVAAELEVKREESDAKTALEVDTVTDGEGGTKLVKFKPFARWSPPVQVAVKLVEGKWKIAEAGLWENKGGIDKGPQYRALPNVYKLPKP